MKYTGTLTVTTHQVGATVFFIENDLPASAAVVRTQNYVYKNASNATVEEIKYQLEGYGEKWFPGAELFASAAAMKTFFENATDGL